MPTDIGRLAGWAGIWLAENLYNGLNGREPEGGIPVIEAMRLSALHAPWNDEGWRLVEATVPAGLAGRGKTRGWGYPMAMSSPAPFKFIITPAETAIINYSRDIRYIYTDGREHEPEDERWATPWGDSIGCWEGDTLVIDTVAVRYVPSYNYLAPPLSENAHFIERMRLTAPGRIESDITITDPETLEEPWQTKIVYSRHPGDQRLVHDGETFENDRIASEDGAPTIAEAAKEAPQRALRTSVQLTAAELDRIVGTYSFDGRPAQLNVERRGDRLFARADSIRMFTPFLAEGPLSFFSPVGGSSYRFIVDDDGKAVRFEGTGLGGIPIAGERLD